MTVKEFYDLAKGVGEAEWEDYKGVIVGYCSEKADQKIGEDRLQFIFDVNGCELVGGLSFQEMITNLYWGDTTPETLAKYLKK